MTDKSFMFWGGDNINLAYADGIPIPARSYRCRGSVTVGKGLTQRRHECKLVTDHEAVSENCECICGRTFNHKEGS